MEWLGAVCVILAISFTAALMLLITFYKSNSYYVGLSAELKQKCISYEEEMGNKNATINNLGKVITKRVYDLPDKLLKQIELLHAAFVEKQYPFKEFLEVGVVGMILDVGEKTLFEILREEKILVSKKGHEFNCPYRRYVEAGYFKIEHVPFTKEGTARKETYLKTVVTHKGIDFIRKVLSRREEQGIAA